MTKRILLALSFLFIGATTSYAGCSDPQTQTEMNICAGDEFRAADKQLNTLYAKNFPSLDAKHKGALKKAQLAWITYRDLACLSYGLRAEGGTMHSMLVNNCRTAITRQRIKLLADELKTY